MKYNLSSIMRAAWPKYEESLEFPQEAATMECVMELIRAIRNVRAERKVPMGMKIKAKLVVPDPKAFGPVEKLLEKLIGAENTEITAERGDVQKTDVHLVCSGAEAYIPLASLVDLDEERARIDKEIERMNGEVARAQGTLSNEKFVSKAPAAKIEEEKAKLAKYTQMMDQVKERLAQLQ